MLFTHIVYQTLSIAYVFDGSIGALKAMDFQLSD